MLINLMPLNKHIVLTFPLQVIGVLLCLGIAGVSIYGLVIPKGNTIQDGWSVVEVDTAYIGQVRLSYSTK